jgi:CRP/FNR family transcriptional regulator, cyclic AMP receptor protein
MGRTDTVRLVPRVSTLLLKNVPLLSTLSDRQIAVLLKSVRRRTYPRGAVIIEAGEPASSLQIVLSGRLLVVMRDEHGAEVILAMLRAGDYFGEMALIDDAPRSARVVVRESCDVLILDKEDFARCLRQNSGLAMEVTRGLVRRLRDADTRIANLALLDVYGRVAAILLQITENTEQSEGVADRISKMDIAKMIGASREMVSRVMKDLERRGYLEIRGTSIFIRNRVALLDGEPLLAKSLATRMQG